MAQKKKTKWEKEQEQFEQKARQDEVEARCKVQFFLRDGTDMPPGVQTETECPSLVKLLHSWMSCYFIGGFECFIRYTDDDGSVYDIPIPLVDDHDFGLRHYHLPSSEIIALKKQTVFWKRHDEIRL